MATVTFKTKLRTVQDGDRQRSIVQFKKVVGRVDCDLKPHQHSLYNSDLFVPMLNRSYNEALGGLTWAWVDALPQGVELDSTGFLASVTVTLPPAFNR